MKYTCLLILLVASFQSNACEQLSEDCVETNQWQFSVSLGAGTLTNPLYSGKNIPLYVIPSFNFYGEKLFIENNTLGYTIHENERWSVSIISQINREKVFFASDSASALLLPSNAFLEGSLTSKDANLDHRDVKKRKWSLDGGLQLNGFFKEGYFANIQLLTDITSVHKGSNALLEMGKVSTPELLNNTKISWSLGANWSDSKLMNYYYGISEITVNDSEHSYSASSSLNPFVKLNITKNINNNWHARFSIKREYLSNSYQHSPLINDDRIDIIFAGVTYAF